MRWVAGRVWSGMPSLQPGGSGSPRMGASAHVWCGGSYRRVWCLRPADNRFGAAGAETLARALPPSLTTLKLISTCGLGLGLVLRPLLVRACAAGRVRCGMPSLQPGNGGSARSGRLRMYGARGQYWRVWCSRPAGNRIGAAGAETLARARPPSLTTLNLSGTCGLGLGLVLRPLLFRACAGLRVACGAVCRACDRVAADRV